MSGWKVIKNPSQELLDELLEKAKKDWAGRNCPDCGVKVGEMHEEGCDVAQCSVCMLQRLSCGCKDGDGGKWDGLWPGIMECYEKKLVTTFNGGEPVFDLNTLASMRH
jgi:hypothetical protein